jgi:hypothetical protein
MKTLLGLPVNSTVLPWRRRLVWLARNNPFHFGGQKKQKNLVGDRLGTILTSLWGNNRHKDFEIIREMLS